MPLILAIEPDRQQASQVTAVVRGRLRAELVLADAAEPALAQLGARVPDLILTSALLSPKDEAVLEDRLREWDAAASHVQTLTIPVLDTPEPRVTFGRGLFSRITEKVSSPAAPDGCDPAVFADQCAAYLERAVSERDQDLSVEPPAESPAESIAPRPAAEMTKGGYDTRATHPAHPEPVEGERGSVEPPHVVADPPAPFEPPQATLESANVEAPLPEDDEIEQVNAAPIAAEASIPVAEEETDPVFVAELAATLDALPLPRLVIPAPELPPIVMPPAPEPVALRKEPEPEVAVPVETAPPPAPAPVAAAPTPAPAAAPVPEEIEIDLSSMLDETVVRQLSEAIESVSRDSIRLSAERSPANDDPWTPAPIAPSMPWHDPADAADNNRPHAARQRAFPERKPIQDEWGFFDPAQCGFAALLAKLDEITSVASSLPGSDPTAGPHDVTR